jgi:hypothetical protein
MLHLKSALALLIAIITGNQLTAQRNYYYTDKYYENALVFELGATGGLINALTDLGGKKGTGKNFIKDLRWKTAKPACGVYLLANYADKLCLRIEGIIGQVVGYDSILKNVATSTFGRYERNLSFRSKISELHLALELHPLLFKNYLTNEMPLLSPYIAGGIGVYTFDPQAQLNGYWHRLQPLSLEGQGFTEYKNRKPYKLTQLNFIAGVGLRYQLSSLITARVEFVHRKLFTDYLDDVSTTYIDPSVFAHYLNPAKAAVAQKLYNRNAQIMPGTTAHINEQRGDIKDNDAYFTILFKLGIILGRQKAWQNRNSRCNLVDL